ncbi:MAG: SDR family NAD(P)-dependent oxidoreductase [Paludibacteraceae bacterium]|nr:SDR family NAD(P)-dependent oxidoreductase [Paludibacteraceae bacterium]
MLIKKILYPCWKLSDEKLHSKFENKRVLITGASHGIGRELACRLMSCQTKLLLVARDINELQALCDKAASMGCEAEYRSVDLRDRTALDALCEELRQQNTPIDYYFANAGKSIHREITNSLDRLHDYDRTMDVNYRAMVALALTCIPLMKPVKGIMVYTSSVSSLYPPAPGWSAYHASKCAGNTWCETANAELSRHGVHVKIAYMPLVHTQMSDVNATYKKMPAYTAAEAAELLIRLAVGCRETYKPWWTRITSPLATLLSPIIHFVYKHIS